MNGDFDKLVLEKLNSVESRLSSIEKQINTLIDAFSNLNQSIADINARCVRNHAGPGSPLPGVVGES